MERLHRAVYKFIEERISPLENYKQAEKLAMEHRLGGIRDKALSVTEPVI